MTKFNKKWDIQQIFILIQWNKDWLYTYSSKQWDLHDMHVFKKKVEQITNEYSENKRPKKYKTDVYCNKSLNTFKLTSNMVQHNSHKTREKSLLRDQIYPFSKILVTISLHL